MSKKTRVEHKEYKQFKSSGKVPYSDDQYDQIKSQFLPRSQLDKLDPQSNGHREYHYEYKEEKTGKNDKNSQVEEYSIPTKSKPKNSESSTYYYERAEKELPTINNNARTYNYESNIAPGYSIIKNVNSSQTTKKDLAHNVDELDSLLVDLQKDQQRSLSKSGYISDTNESTFSDFRRGTTPTSNNGYSSLRKEERIESSTWKRSPPPPPVVTKVFKEEKYTSGYTSDTNDSTYDYKRTLDKAPSSGYSTLKKEERVDHHSSSSWVAPSPPVVRKEIRQEERVDHHTTSSSWVAPSPPVTRKEMRQEMFQETHESRIIPSQISPAIPHQVPAPTPSFYQPPSTPTLTRGGPMNKVTTTVKTYTYEVPADEPVPITTREHTYLASTDKHTSTTHHIPPPVPQTTSYNYKYSSNDLRDERVVYPQPANETRIIPAVNEPDRGPYLPPGQSSYKFSETLISREDRREHLESPIPFPSPAPPSARQQQPPKALDDLLNDFPEARFPTTDGMYQRKVEVFHENSKTESKKAAPPIGNSKNVAGPAVYYPPNHTPFQPKEESKSMAMAANGAHASGRGMYEYESGSKTTEKTKEKKTAVPICLPLCCAMPCVIM